MKTLAAAALVLVTASARPMDLSPYEAHGYIDLRVATVNSALPSFVDGGLGLLRFDADNDGLRLGRAALDLSGPVTESIRGGLTAIVTDDGQNAIDLTEAFLEWRPYPKSQLRWRSKLGAFYPPISLENRGVAWQSVYSLSPSAINTWIGEEIRTIGLEVTATSVGAVSERPFDIGLVGSIFGWNDPAGVLLFQRGWAIHDRESALFDALARPFSRTPYDHRIELFHELDNRPGYYGGVEAKWHGRHVLRALHYDNRADPAAANQSDTSWLTRFDSVGARVELPANVTAIVQGMRGDTAVGPSADGRGMLIADYWSYFALASYLNGRHRMTLRYDRMYVDSVRGMQIVHNHQNATGWTVAYLLNWDERWLVGIEGLRIDGSLRQRQRTGLPAAASEEQLQIAVRYSF